MKPNVFSAGGCYVLQQKGRYFEITDSAKTSVYRLTQRQNVISKWSSEKTSRLLFPFRYEITDEKKQLLFVIERQAGIIWNDIFIFDYLGHRLGSLTQQSLFLQPVFCVNNEAGKEVARLTGDWLGQHYRLKAETGATWGQMKRGISDSVSRLLGVTNNYTFSISRHCPYNIIKLAGVCLLFSGMLNRESRIYLSNRS